MSGAGVELMISLPRRDQTLEEIERTKQFAVDAVDLLKHSPQYRMPFSRFIPAYHHHFTRQCRVADYGFTKLIELFEAIPHVVQVTADQTSCSQIEINICISVRTIDHCTAVLIHCLLCR